MTANTTSGLTVFIAAYEFDATTLDVADKAARIAAYEALDWIEVNEVESVGDIGDQWKSTTFVNMKDARERLYKTIRQGGTPDVVVGRDPLDAGQLALQAASETKFVWPIKVEYDDARSISHTNSIAYFGAQVMGDRDNIGSAENILKRTFGLSIVTQVTRDESHTV